MTNPDPLRVIALCGRARSGKDTLSRHLVTRYDYFRIALADGVRSILDDLDGQTWEFRKERQAAGISDRTAQQVAGTECRLDIGDAQHWVNHWLMKARYASHYHVVPRRRFVIPDLRYPYEAEWIGDRIREWGGVFWCWRIVRQGTGRIAESGHSSERSVEDVPVDAELFNDGTKGELFALADHLLGNARE